MFWAMAISSNILNPLDHRASRFLSQESRAHKIGQRFVR